MRLIRAGIHFYFSGIIILTLGIALTIQSALGASPFDALLVGLHRTFGLSVGSWEIVVGLSMILCNALLEKKRPEYVALITSLLTGIGIDAWLITLGGWVEPSTLMGQSATLAAGIIFIGMGIALYLQSSIAPNPMDRSMLIISDLTGWNVTYSRALISVGLVVVAFIFNGAIGIGTLINALISGLVISFFLPYAKVLRTGGRKQRQNLAG
ncbi:YitT family protein [Virgibacillus kekensis]|uniref:YitT family protein n=1 Tax=Virgibacillus kekensis TaxID=202261 RepID=A0ABV9DLY0_9BACI